MGVGGGRERNKIVKVCEVIEFYIGESNKGKIINYIIYF